LQFDSLNDSIFLINSARDEIKAKNQFRQNIEFKMIIDLICSNVPLTRLNEVIALSVRNLKPECIAYISSQSTMERLVRYKLHDLSFQLLGLKFVREVQDHCAMMTDETTKEGKNFVQQKFCTTTVQWTLLTKKLKSSMIVVRISLCDCKLCFYYFCLGLQIR